MTFLVEKGLPREVSYDNVQRIANQVYDNEKLNFKDALNNDNFINKYINKQVLDKLFDESYFLRNVDYIYKRVGLFD